MDTNELLRRVNKEQARLRDTTSLLAREQESLARNNENYGRLAQLMLQTLEACIVQAVQHRERENSLMQENNSLKTRIREVEWLYDNLQHEYWTYRQRRIRRRHRSNPIGPSRGITHNPQELNDIPTSPGYSPMHTSTLVLHQIIAKALLSLRYTAHLHTVLQALPTAQTSTIEHFIFFISICLT